uniref:Putative secreted peptide n=1 Tax=Anopheles braziliensis TaxID=58242 RepID=A0A2M3ZPW0_9DIPT
MPFCVFIVLFFLVPFLYSITLNPGIRAPVVGRSDSSTSFIYILQPPGNHCRHHRYDDGRKLGKERTINDDC